MGWFCNCGLILFSLLSRFFTHFPTRDQQKELTHLQSISGQLYNYSYTTIPHIHCSSGNLLPSLDMIIYVYVYSYPVAWKQLSLFPCIEFELHGLDETGVFCINWIPIWITIVQYILKFPWVVLAVRVFPYPLQRWSGGVFFGLVVMWWLVKWAWTAVSLLSGCVWIWLCSGQKWGICSAIWPLAVLCS